MKNFLRDQSGATAIEYALIATAMTVCLVAAMPLLTSALSTRFGTINTSFANIK